MKLPKRLNGRLSPLLVATIVASLTGYHFVHGWMTGSASLFGGTLFALALLLIVASLMIKPNLQ